MIIIMLPSNNTLRSPILDVPMSRVEQFDHVFLGSGRGGKTLALELAQAGKRVALIEKGMFGGACPNIASIPSKALVCDAHAAHAALGSGPVSQMDAGLINLGRISQRVRSLVGGLNKLNRSAFLDAGIDLVVGTGHFEAPRRLAVSLAGGGTRLIEGEHVYINTGTTPHIPDIPGLAESRPLTHVEAFELGSLPEELIVIGGGYIGMELAQAFRRLGSRVSLIQSASRLAPREDPDVSSAIEASFKSDGIRVHLDSTPVRVDGTSGRAVTVTMEDGGQLSGTHILVAAGRKPVTGGLGLDAAGVKLDERGFVLVTDCLATTAERTWAIGEVAGSPMFSHASYDDYRVLAAQLNGGTRTTKNRVVPHTLFIDPELARIGLNEIEAKARGIDVRVTTLPVSVIPRARANGDTRGFMKALVDAHSERILGFTMLGTNAGEVVTAVQMAMLGGLPYTAVRDAVIGHPLMSEGLMLLFSNVPRT